jgi:hypothetical protein
MRRLSILWIPFSLLKLSAEIQISVKTQVWIAVCVYVLVAILKKELNLSESLHQNLQNLSVNAFEKVQIDQLLMKTLNQDQEDEDRNQLNLFNF